MKRALAIPLVMLAFVAAASGPGSAADGTRPLFGVSEDAAKYADDGGQTMYDDLEQLGMSEVKFVVFWNADEPATIQEKAFLDRSVPVAAKNGINVIFAVTHARATMLTRSPEAPDQFAAYLAQLARTYPTVKEFIVGNEPNQPRFFQPQFDASGDNVSGALYTNILAKGYDSLKAVDPNIIVIGVGLSPRGNDNPNAPNNVSTSPTRFIKYMGDAYRASGRTKPLMDLFGLHLYPNDPSKDTPATQVAWPNVSFATLTRLQQAVWDAFDGTAQPTFVQSASSRSLAAVPPSLRWKLDEIGWQTEVQETFKTFYKGTENVKPTSEATQANHYAFMIRNALCNSAIAELLFFHLIDESDLDRFQSGLKRADGSQKPAFQGVAEALRKGCEEAIASTPWSPTRTVQVRLFSRGPRNLAGDWKYPTFTAATVEDAAREALYIRIDGKTFDPRDASDRARLVQLFADGGRRALQARVRGLTVLARSKALLKAYVTQTIKPPPVVNRNLAPGTYVLAMRTRAWANPERTSLWISPLIRVPKR